MGATFSVVLYGSDRASMNQAMDAAFEEAHRLDALLSNYRPASEWSRINREAAARPVAVSPELFRLLSDCVEYSRASEGTFDLTVGPLMRAWGFSGGGRHVPSPDQIREALELVGYRHVQLNARKRTVRFDRPGVEIDPGGVGKGYAVDRMVEVLRARGIRNALVAASGSSIFGLGNPPEEPRGWPISIADPGTTGRTRRRCSSKTCLSPPRAATRNHSVPSDAVTRTSWTPAAAFRPKALFR